MTVLFPISIDWQVSLSYMIVILLDVLAERGYVLKCHIREKRKYSFENDLVEKSKSSALDKWLSRRIVLYNQLGCFNLR